MNNISDGEKLTFIVGWVVGLIFGMVLGCLIPKVGEFKREPSNTNAQTQTHIVCKQEASLAPAVIVHDVDGGVLAECVLQRQSN